MAWFLVRRLGLLVVALLVATVIVFALLRLVPGDLAVVIAGTEVTPERLAGSAPTSDSTAPCSPSTSTGWAVS